MTLIRIIAVAAITISFFALPNVVTGNSEKTNRMLEPGRPPHKIRGGCGWAS
jgi:hypothetical protein